MHPYDVRAAQLLSGPLDVSKRLVENDSARRLTGNFLARERYCKSFGFALLTHEFVSDVVDFLGKRKTLEVMAGSGWFAHWLNKWGADVKATDNMSWHKRDLGDPWWSVRGFDVAEEDAVEAVRATDAEVVIMSWPYMDDTAFHVWEALRPGQTLLYIGEGAYGCTANDRFFDAVHDRLSYDTRIESLVQWDGIHDDCFPIKR